MLQYKIGCIWDANSQLAKSAFHEIKQRYPFIQSMPINNDVHVEDYIKLRSDVIENNAFNTSYDFIITIGGDGVMLKALHIFMESNVKIFGINRGSKGFLLNEYCLESLIENLYNAECIILHPIEMQVIDINGKLYSAKAVNEISLIRQTPQTAKIQIKINEIVRMEKLVADGIMISTSAGSTAYNSAAHGPIVPLDANVLLLTPICPFVPKRWNGAVLSNNTKIQFNVLDAAKRLVSASADSLEIKNVKEVHIAQRYDIEMKILFDKHNSFQERILKEQFGGVCD